MNLNKVSETQTYPIWKKILEDITGGVTVAVADIKSSTSEIKAGTIVGEGATAGLFHICKAAEVYANAASTTVLILTNHEFKVGDFICNGLRSTAITVIATGDDYDTLTLTAALTVVDGDALYEGTSEGIDDADIAAKYTAKGITKATVVTRAYYPQDDGYVALSNVTASVIVRGTINESLMPFIVPTVYKTALTDRIIFD